MIAEAKLFAVLVKPWLDKVLETKDLKPLRAAEYTQDLMGDLAVLKHFEGVRDVRLQNELTLSQLHECIPPLMDKLVRSDVGGKQMRQDLWRRLKYWMLTHPLEN